MVAILAITANLFFGRTLRNEEKTYVYVDADDDIDSVCAKVKEAARPRTLAGMRILSELAGYKDHIRTGRYAITPGMSILRLFRNLRGHVQEPVRLVIPTVRTLDDLAGRLSARLMLDSLTLARAFADSAVCRSVGMSRATMPALFVPDTYEVYWDIPLETFLQRMKREHDVFWTDVRLAKASELGLTPEQVVTLASIVDAESNYAPEKPRIAGLYLNRLKAHVPLQSDPTVIFAIGDFGIRRVVKEQTRFPSPYNTYLNEGLPPGPVRIATAQGIDAVLSPEQHDYLYMCAKEDFSGSHNFASNYAEHQRNARRYAQALNERGIMK